MPAIQFGFCVPIFAYPGGRFFRTPNYAKLDVATTMQIAVAAALDRIMLTPLAPSSTNLDSLARV